MKPDRRDFLKTSGTGAAAALAGSLSLVSNVHAAGTDMIKVGLFGCGGRGTGVAENCISSAKNVKIVALADVFEDRLAGCRKFLSKFADKTDLPAERCHVGLDAYERLLKEDIDLVILATPP